MAKRGNLSGGDDEKKDQRLGEVGYGDFCKIKGGRRAIRGGGGSLGQMELVVGCLVRGDKSKT